MSIHLESALLRSAAQTIEDNLTPETLASYSNIVVAGTKVPPYRGPNGLYRRPNGCLALLRDSKDPIGQCVSDAINRCLEMRVRHHAMPVQAVIPAAMTLALAALDVAEKIGVVKIGTDELDRATQLFANLIFEEFGLTSEMIHTAVGRVHALTEDPEAMEKINHQAGITKAPNASAPSLMAASALAGGGDGTA